MRFVITPDSAPPPRNKRTVVRRHKLYRRYRTMVLYFFIGLSGAIIDMTVSLLAVSLFNIPHQVAIVVGAHLGLINTFVLNVRFNFKTGKHKLALRFLSYLAMAEICLAMRELIQQFAIERAGFPAKTSMVGALISVTVASFFFNRYVTFRAKPADGGRL